MGMFKRAHLRPRTSHGLILFSTGVDRRAGTATCACPEAWAWASSGQKGDNVWFSNQTLRPAHACGKVSNKGDAASVPTHHMRRNMRALIHAW